MAHFPASLSMSRLAGSSGTQKVCEATKSRNKTGLVISKSGRSRLSQMPAAMTQRGLKHHSERRQLKVSGGVPRGRRCPKSCSCCVSRTHRKWPAFPPTQRHPVLRMFGLSCVLPLDNEIDFAGLEAVEGLKVVNLKPQKFISSSRWSRCTKRRLPPVEGV